MTNWILSRGLHDQFINGSKSAYAAAPDTFKTLPACHPVGASRAQHLSNGSACFHDAKPTSDGSSSHFGLSFAYQIDK